MNRFVTASICRRYYFWINMTFDACIRHNLCWPKYLPAVLGGLAARSSWKEWWSHVLVQLHLESYCQGSNLKTVATQQKTEAVGVVRFLSKQTKYTKQKLRNPRTENANNLQWDLTATQHQRSLKNVFSVLNNANLVVVNVNFHSFFQQLKNPLQAITKMLAECGLPEETTKTRWR